VPINRRWRERAVKAAAAVQIARRLANVRHSGIPRPHAKPTCHIRTALARCGRSRFCRDICRKGSGVALAPTSNNNTIGVPLVSNHLHNLFRVTTNIFSGDSPVSDAAFLELAKLGVKTIISVDGSKPDVDSARKHGLRYIHLPFGYDGIPTNRIAELVKAGQSANGPIYVHCHHGLHRGPAAVAILCQASMGWSTNQALAWLKQAGTASDYTGLYRAVEDFSNARFERPGRSHEASRNNEGLLARRGHGRH
jgi:protein tyrosine phosphatase (PTP) superfamily phosphohydrolase (DUF442 family)